MAGSDASPFEPYEYGLDLERQQTLRKFVLTVVGSRSYPKLEAVGRTIEYHAVERKGLVLITGGADGVDKAAELWARNKLVPCVVALPDYKGRGRASPLLRNTDMILCASLVLAFWDGTSAGTHDSINKASRYDVPLIVYGPDGERM